MISVQWIDPVDRDWHQRLIRHFAKPGMEFELQCWQEETEAIELAKSVAQQVPTEWKGGCVFRGIVSEENLAVLSLARKVEKCWEECSLFFAILVGGLSCEHWGSELHIEGHAQDAELKSLLEEIREKAAVSEC